MPGTPVAALSPCGIPNTDVTPRARACASSRSSQPCASRVPTPPRNAPAAALFTSPIHHASTPPSTPMCSVLNRDLLHWMRKQPTSTPNARRPRRLISHGRGLTGTQCPPSTTAVEDAAMGHSTARAEWIWPLHRQGCHPDPFHRESAACLIVVSVGRVPHRKGCRLQHTPPCGRRRVPLHVPFGGQPCSSSESFVNTSLPWWRLLIQS